ncbi:hypothetical protein HMPREF9406_0832 [Clostridium sp. HGF2]|nr:hypothetical protein HMPREF9406_0832 [Clostridium sp. HGF2]EQJ57329.1 putative membrane protein [Clostridioides difficile P28]
MYECFYFMPICIGGFFLFGMYMDIFVNAIQRLEKHVCI